MNLLRPITVDSDGNERNTNVFFHHYKTLKWKISANQGENSFKLCMSDF